MRLALAFILTTCAISNSFGQDTCSRLAIINYQQVLVDTNSTQKGEGLRYYLEKDPVAMSYLDSYQEGTKLNWQNAFFGTAGTAMILSSFVVHSNGENKDTLLFGGLAMILVNFLLANANEGINEKNLEKAIEEYNKRNLPRIQFNPTSSVDSSPRFSPEIVISKSWSF